MTVASDQAGHTGQSGTVAERIADTWQVGGGTSEHMLDGMTDRQREALTDDPVFGPVVRELQGREAAAARDYEAAAGILRDNGATAGEAERFVGAVRDLEAGQ